MRGLCFRDGATMSYAAMMLVGLAIDALFGWPDAIYRRIGHPVTWIGALISKLERQWNTGARRRRLFTGLVTALLVIAIPAGAMMLVQIFLKPDLPGIVLGGILAWPFIAAKSMHEHVEAVRAPLSDDDLEMAQSAVGIIVGRNPALLDEAGVARASIESLAENTGDGVVAPLFWGVIGGLPGIAAYKALNTLDSMIGHRTPRYEAFGKVSARLDDVANWVPARLTGLFFALGALGRAPRAFRAVLRDAGKHRSPNAGWPEAAMAGALHVRLSGPRTYEGRVSDEPWINEAAPDPTPKDIGRALSLFRRTVLILGVALLLLALV